jgi:hypothetical protein
MAFTRSPDSGPSVDGDTPEESFREAFVRLTHEHAGADTDVLELVRSGVLLVHGIEPLMGPRLKAACSKERIPKDVLPALNSTKISFT